MNDEELRRRIAERARQLWEEAGRPEGRDMEYWLEAEEELAPLSVAYADPALRAAGLAGDTVGDAAAFFGLSHEQLHYLLCFCHHGEMLTASAVAAQVRALTRQVDAAACWVVGVGFGAAAVAVLALVGMVL